MLTRILILLYLLSCGVGCAVHESTWGREYLKNLEQGRAYEDAKNRR